MNIILSPEVKNRLTMTRSKSMTIYAKLMSSCWSPRQEIFVFLEEPEVPMGYNKHEVDGINIYLYKDAILEGDSIEIKLAEYASDLPDKDFDVHGLVV